MDVSEAEGVELVLCPGDGVHVVVRAGEAGADAVGEEGGRSRRPGR